MRRSASWDASGLLVAMFFPTGAAWLYFVTFAGARAMPAVYALCKIVQFALPVAWLLLFGVRRGMRIRPASGDVARGALSGLAIVATLAIVYLALLKGGELAQSAAPRIAARVAEMGAASPGRFLALTAFLSLAHSFLEEYYWRWFVFGLLRERTGPLSAGILSSLCFAGHHVIVLHSFIGPGPYAWMTVMLSAAVALGGGLWAWLYARSGSLFAPWLSHALVDLGIMTIGFDLAGGFS